MTRFKYLRYLDPALGVQIAFPIFMLLFFLIAPILMVLVAAGHYNLLGIFTDPTMIRIPSLNEFLKGFVKSGRLGNYTIIRVTGVSFGIILNSLITATVVTIIASILGIIVAFVLARYTFPGRNILRILAIVPLLMTPFINSFVIKRVFHWNYGLLSWFITSVLGIPVKIGIEEYVGVAFAQIITFYPIVYLNVYSSMVNIDPSLEEQAENLGARGFRLFRTVTLPLSLPGLAAGAAIVFIFSLEDVAGPIVFERKDYISYRILERFQSAYTGQMDPEAAVLALILLSLALAAFVLIKRYVSLRQYAMLSRGGRWTPRVRRLGWKGFLVVYSFIFPLVLFTAFPQIGVFIFAFSEEWITSPIPQGFTFEHIAQIVNDPAVRTAVINSLVYSSSALVLIILMGVSASYAISRARLPGIGLLDILVTMPIALPGLVIAVGYFYFFTTFFRGTALDPITTGPALLLILAYSVRRLPFTARAVFAGLQQLHVALEESAMNLGANRLKVLRDIVIPLIGLNILSGALISFVYCMSEVSTSITLGGLGGIGAEHCAPITFIMKEYIISPTGPYVVAALGVLLISIQLAVIVTINVVLKQRYAYIGV